MTLKVYNTLTRKKELFKPLKDNRVSMFVCGPTVYDFSHIGHARTYIAYDVIARYLRYKGYSVFYVMNITDIDDKIIKRAAERKEKPDALAERFLLEFYKDMGALKVDAMNIYQKATDFVPEIIAQTEGLIKNGYAYESNGSVYFEIGKFKDFGKLSGQDMDKLKAGARIELDKNKKNPEDFVLWKAEKPEEPSWASPWGKGRPGWHIEDTAISLTHFDDQYDLHGGAIDLIFPHHESEIAIAESLTGKKPFVKYWLHTGYLNIDSEKMSKSIGNIIRIKDMLDKYDAMAVRFFMIYTHYRSPIAFNYELLDEAKTAWEYIRNTVQRLKQISVEKGSKDKTVLDALKKTKSAFIAAMDDDFNTREALAKLFDFSKEVNKHLDSISKDAAKKVFSLYVELGTTIGLVFEETNDNDLTDKLMQTIIEIRDKVRKKKDFETSDAIRDKLKKLKITLSDGTEGTKWIKE